MALPTNIQRPIVPYTPAQTGAFADRYTILGKEPPQGFAVDGDVNFLVDNINATNVAVNGIAAGILPGSDEEINKNKFPTTDGEGNISWTLVQNPQMDDNCCDTRNYSDGSITPDKLQPIPGSKLTSNSVPDSAIIGMNGAKLTNNSVSNAKITSLNGLKLLDDSVTDDKIIDLDGSKLIDNTVSDDKIIGLNGSKLTNLSVPTAALVDKCVTVDKMSAGNAPEDTYAKSTGVYGTIEFSPIPAIGKILQIVNYTNRNTAFQTASGTFASFDTPLQVSITMQNSNSTIVVYLSANVSAQSDAYPMSCLGALFKNGSIWTPQTGNTASGGAQTNCLQEIICPDSNSIAPMNAFCLDTGGASGTTNTYELRVFSGRPGYGSYLNRTPSGNGGRTVSSIYAIEIATQ